jgi:hypothetical protein
MARCPILTYQRISNVSIQTPGHVCLVVPVRLTTLYSVSLCGAPELRVMSASSGFV